MVVSAIALAASPARKVTIKKRSGELVKGTIVTEMDTGYLIKLDKAGKTVPVKFDEIADFTEGVSAELPPPPPPAPLPPAPAAMLTPPPSPPPPPPSGPCSANEVYIAFDDDDDVRGAVCALRTEVTVADYQACVNARACSAEQLNCSPQANWGRPDRAAHPINCVSARQAEAYCAWQRARLPSLLEFHALSASPGHEADFPWGDHEPQGRACWSGDRERRGTCPVGSFPNGAGRGGILDIVGNVWEWTATEIRRDRVVAGGAWNDTRNGHLERTSENRTGADEHSDDIGFRCVRAVR